MSGLVPCELIHTVEIEMRGESSPSLSRIRLDRGSHWLEWIPVPQGAAGGKSEMTLSPLPLSSQLPITIGGSIQNLLFCADGNCHFASVKGREFVPTVIFLPKVSQ